MKVSSADKWFSLCVRERAEWRCEKCGTVYAYPTSSRGLDCAHFESRSSHSVRYHPDNAFALCRGCHGYIDDHFFAKEVLYATIFGMEKLEAMRIIWRDHAVTGKANKRNLPAIAKHYMNEYTKMVIKRADGFRGRLEFENYAEST